MQSLDEADQNINPNITLTKTYLKRYLPVKKFAYYKIKYKLPFTECSICCIEMELLDGTRRPYCGHIFHGQCLGDWLNRNENCPICRAKLSKARLEHAYNVYRENLIKKRKLHKLRLIEKKGEVDVSQQLSKSPDKQAYTPNQPSAHSLSGTKQKVFNFKVRQKRRLKRRKGQTEQEYNLEESKEDRIDRKAGATMLSMLIVPAQVQIDPLVTEEDNGSDINSVMQPTQQEVVSPNLDSKYNRPKSEMRIQQSQLKHVKTPMFGGKEVGDFPSPQRNLAIMVDDQTVEEGNPSVVGRRVSSNPLLEEGQGMSLELLDGELEMAINDACLSEDDGNEITSGDHNK